MSVSAAKKEIRFEGQGPGGQRLDRLPSQTGGFEFRQASAAERAAEWVRGYALTFFVVGLGLGAAAAWAAGRLRRAP